MNTRHNATPEGFILDRKNDIRMDSERKANRLSLFENNRKLMMEENKTPSKLKC
jgi:hypothetical protein